MPTPDESTKKAGRLWAFCDRHGMQIAWTEVAVVFLALIRTLTSYYQLAVRPGGVLVARQVDTIIAGSLVAASFCLVLALLSYFHRLWAVHVVFVSAIVALVLVKIFSSTG